MSSPPASASTWRRYRAAARLAGLTIIGVILYVILDTVAQLLPPHYSPIRQAESDLAVGPYGWVMTINFVVRGLFSLALLAALAAVWPSQRRPRAGLMLLGIWSVGAFLLAAFPTDLNGEHSVHGKIHLAVAFVAFLSVTLAELILSGTLAKSGVGGTKGIARALTALAICTLVAFVLLAATLSGRAGGLFERLFLGLALLWMVVVAIQLQRPRSDTSAAAVAT